MISFPSFKSDIIDTQILCNSVEDTFAKTVVSTWDITRMRHH